MCEAVSLEPGVAALSASEIHELAVESFRTGNRGRLTLCGVLRTIEEHRLYLELGYSTVAGYAEAHFDYRRTETLEAIRVARALDTLTGCRDAFADGRIGWSKLRAITRVASEETEGAWLDYAHKHKVQAVEAEVRDALEKKRDTPRSDRYGLPNLEQRLVLRFTRSEMEKVRKGLGRLHEEVAAQLGKQQIPLRDLMLYLCERLATGGAAELDARSGSGGSDAGYAVVYQRCPDCRRSGIRTEEGVVEVDPEEVDRVEGDAHVESVDEDADQEQAQDQHQHQDPGAERDRQTPPRMRRKVKLREGQRCANPHCNRQARHCHHIQPRSEGGPTTMWNEVALCSTCHALIHAGLLTVTGRGGEPLEWTAHGATVDQSIRDRASRSEGMPIVQVSSGIPDEKENKDESDPGKIPPEMLNDLVAGLVRLGFNRADAEQDLRRAAEELDPDERSEKRLLETAIRYRNQRNRAWKDAGHAFQKIWTSLPDKPTYHALRRGRPDSGRTIVYIGLGGRGSAKT